jgi:hypothetical protein
VLGAHGSAVGEREDVVRRDVERLGVRICDVLVGRFGRVTLSKIELVVEKSQKVTLSCAPSHQFFAGRFAAAVLTDNYTFSSGARSQLRVSKAR